MKKRMKHRRHRMMGLEDDESPSATIQAVELGEGEDALLALWGLRMLLEMEGWQELVDFNEQVELDRRAWRLLGLRPSRPSVPLERFEEAARDQLASLEERDPKPHPEVHRNVTRLGEHLGLDACERALLVFFIYLKSVGTLEELHNNLPRDRVDTRHVMNSISLLVGHPEERVVEALSEQGRLTRLGLLRWEEGWGDLDSRASLMEGLSSLMFQSHQDLEQMLYDYFHLAETSKLDIDDFPHVAATLDSLTRYLGESLEQAAQGVNVLVYGPPGTGKTELSRMLVQRLGKVGFEVSVADRQGRPLEGKRRVDAYRLAQGVIAADRKGLLIFDEVEEVFGGDFQILELLLGGGSPSQNDKGWLNRLLEKNTIPAIWICNDPRRIDPAQLRRFDFVLELPVPPRAVRERILSRELPQGMVRSHWIKAMSEYADISPAMVNRAAGIVTRLGLKEPEAVEQEMETRINAWRQALDLPRVSGRLKKPSSYRIDVLNTHPPIEPLSDGLVESGFGRLCLWGAPGTGKTAFGKNLAERLERPLLVRRASELLGPYVGESEYNIARMFREAQSQHAVLLIDEADSFLRKRRGAQHSWEVTQVNELLTRMEDFDGLFICSTNLMGDIDEAALRRFDLKIEFKPMTGEQASWMFEQMLLDAGMEIPDSCLERIRRMDGLTPGDFATVQRRLSVSRQAMEASRMLDALAEELDWRKPAKRPIGFHAEIA